MREPRARRRGGGASPLPAHPYPFCCGLSRGGRACSVQEQSHFQSRAHASHPSRGGIGRTAVPKATSVPGYLVLWVAPGSRWLRRRSSAEGMSTPGGRARRWRKGRLWAPPAAAAVTQAVPGAQALRLGWLGVAWPPRPDPCAQRDGRSAV